MITPLKHKPRTREDLSRSTAAPIAAGSLCAGDAEGLRRAEPALSLSSAGDPFRERSAGRGLVGATYSNDEMATPRPEIENILQKAILRVMKMGGAEARGEIVRTYRQT